MIWLALLIALPGAVDCESYMDVYEGTIHDEVSCWRQSYNVWEEVIAQVSARIVELEIMVDVLSAVIIENDSPQSLSDAVDFGLFHVAVPTGWITDVYGEPRIAGLLIPDNTRIPGVSTLSMIHPATDEYPVPVAISVTVSPDAGGLARHIAWEDALVFSIMSDMEEKYDNVAYWSDLGSARAGSGAYLREGGLEIGGIMAYHSATYLAFDNNMAYYVGLSAPPHLFESYRGLLDDIYQTFEID